MKYRLEKILDRFMFKSWHIQNIWIFKPTNIYFSEDIVYHSLNIHVTEFLKICRLMKGSSKLLTNSQCFGCLFPRSTKASCCYGSRPTDISSHMHRGYPVAQSTHPAVPCKGHDENTNKGLLNSFNHEFYF